MWHTRFWKVYVFVFFLIWSDHHLHVMRTVPLDTVGALHQYGATGCKLPTVPFIYYWQGMQARTAALQTLYCTFSQFSICFCLLLSLALTNCSRVKTPVCTLSVRMSFCHEISGQLVLCFESHCWILGIGHGWLKGKFPTNPATSAAFLDGLIIQMRPQASTPVS